MRDTLRFIAVAILVVDISIILAKQAEDYHKEEMAAITQSETITVYTSKDILYLEGNHFFSESGQFDIQFPTRTRALNFLEQMTADIVNDTEHE